MSDDEAQPLLEATVGQSVDSAQADDDLVGTAAMLQRICRGTTQALSLHGCAIHLVGNAGTAALAASSDRWSSAVADLVFTSGEGPRLDSLALRRPVLVSDLVNEGQRWPGFAQAAGEMGLGAVFSFPLTIGALVMGVFELYSRHAHALSDEEVRLALAFADLTIRTLVGDETPGADGTWERLVDHRGEVHQAQGMVMVDLGVGLGEALVRMRAHAFVEGISVIDLARAIIAGLVLPSAGPDS